MTGYTCFKKQGDEQRTFPALPAFPISAFPAPIYNDVALSHVPPLPTEPQPHLSKDDLGASLHDAIETQE